MMQMLLFLPHKLHQPAMTMGHPQLNRCHNTKRQQPMQPLHPIGLHFSNYIPAILL